jgi:hypothetical protein
MEPINRLEGILDKDSFGVGVADTIYISPHF